MSRSNGPPPAPPGQRPQQWSQPQEQAEHGGWTDPNAAYADGHYHPAEPAQLPPAQAASVRGRAAAPPPLDPHAGYHYPSAAPAAQAYPQAYPTPTPPPVQRHAAPAATPPPPPQSFDRFAPPPQRAPQAWPAEPTYAPQGYAQPGGNPSHAAAASHDPHALGYPQEPSLGRAAGAPAGGGAGYDGLRTGPPPIQPDPRRELRGPSYDQDLPAPAHEQWSTGRAAPHQTTHPSGFDPAYATRGAPPPQAWDQDHRQVHAQHLGHSLHPDAAHASHAHASYGQAGQGHPGHPQPGHPHAGHQVYADHDPHAQGHAGRGEPSLDLASYGAPPPATYEGGRELAHEEAYDHDGAEEYEDEQPRRSRGLLIVAALVGAIGLGGGLAFAYKTFLAPSGGNARPPVVKSDTRPVKTQPADPGGKQFANRDSKYLDRLAAAPDSSQSGSSSDESDGVKRVKSITIGRDGSIGQPTPSASAAAAAPTLVNPLPGMTIVDGFAGPARPQPPPAAAPGQGRVAIGSPPPERAPPPEVKTISLPPPSASPPPAAGPQRAAPAPQQKAAVALPPPRTIDTSGSVATTRATAVPPAAIAPAPKKPSVRPPVDAASATGAAGLGAAATGGGSNFVAVLASQRSSMEALKTFADLQQKYGVLQGKSPMVRETNLGDKGVYHRLLVGPPGSRAQAAALCSELKTAGYAGCWITNAN